MNYELENKPVSFMGVPLPGGINQLKHLLEQNFPGGKRALFIGSTTASTVIKLNNYSEIFVISDNYDSLINLRINLKELDSIKIKMMDYSHTDFKDNDVDLIYAQGSISVYERKNILKEMKRILSVSGVLSVGEIVSIKEPVAGFVKDIWEQSGVEPIPSHSINKFYTDRGFEIVSEKDLSYTLKEYYEKVRYAVSKTGKDEKEQNKKLLSRMKHESNAYLKLGGDKYIGFKSLILRKSN